MNFEKASTAGARSSERESGGRVLVIFNPASGRGRGGTRRQAYIDLLTGAGVDFDHVTTTEPGQEREHAERALSRGVDTIVAAGGDGTWSNVAGSIVSSGRNDVSLGLLPAGTGNDFAKSFGISYSDPARAVRAIASGHTRTVDVGRIRFTRAEADGPARHFLLETSFGIGPAVLQAAAGARVLKGNLLYSVTALRQIFSFEGSMAEVEASGETVSAGDHLMLVFANGPNMGGSFLIAPDALLDDGLIDVCAIRDTNALGRLRLFRQVGSGAHGTSPGVTLLQRAAFTIRFPDRVPFEVDGELLFSETNAARVESVPGALRVLEPRA